MTRRVLVALLASLAAGPALAQQAARVPSESGTEKVARALSAAPARVASAARVVELDAQGRMTVLREGTNGFTCVPGHPGVVGDPPCCMDAAGLQWVLDWMARRPRPTNTQPGIIYQLAGASDWSATDPFATSGTPLRWKPGWVIAWPFDPTTTGLSTEPKDTGTWIMWAGTPYAHLMIMQVP